MRLAPKPLLFAVFAALATTSAGRPAQADVTKDQCVDANGTGQQLRRDGKLGGARAQFQTCAKPACPALVRDDCTKRLDEVERAQPSVVFDVKDGHGRDLTAVHVSVDGTALTDHLDGRPLEVDPGEHAFVFEATGHPPFTQTLVIREGDKDVHARVVVEPTEPAVTAPPPSGAGSPSGGPPDNAPGIDASSDGAKSRRIAGAVMAAGGLVGIGVGAVFGGLTLSSVSNQNQACPSSGCTAADHAQASSEHSTAETDRVGSIIGFAAGGALLVSGALLYFMNPATGPGRQVGLTILPSAGPGQASMQLKGTF